MLVEMVTREDLVVFRNEIIEALKSMVQPQEPVKPWLRSHEVRKLLGISSGTLQNLRLNGLLTYSKVGGSVFYKHEDIKKILERGIKK
jgi:hypothetical protein